METSLFGQCLTRHGQRIDKECSELDRCLLEISAKTVEEVCLLFSFHMLCRTSKQLQKFQNITVGRGNQHLLPLLPMRFLL